MVSSEIRYNLIHFQTVNETQGIELVYATGNEIRIRVRQDVKQKRNFTSIFTLIVSWSLTKLLFLRILFKKKNNYFALSNYLMQCFEITMKEDKRR